MQDERRRCLGADRGGCPPGRSASPLEAEAEADDPVPVGRAPWNPLLDLHRRAQGRAGAREQAIARYGFAVPNDEALDLIVAWSPEGVVELGAGVGYLARLLADRGMIRRKRCLPRVRLPGRRRRIRWRLGGTGRG